MQALKYLKNASAKVKANVVAMIGILVTGIVFLFVGIYMMSQVANVTAISNTSDFYATYTQTVTTASTVFNVAGLVLIVVALSYALASLRNVAG